MQICTASLIVFSMLVRQMLIDLLWSYEAVCYWRCSVISTPALRFLMSCGSDRLQSVSMKGSEMLCLCLSIGGLCCFVLLHLDQGPSHWLGRPAPHLSVRFYFAAGLLTVCAFYLLSPPWTFLTVSICIFLFVTPSLCIFSTSIFSSSSCSFLLSATCVYLTSSLQSHSRLPPPWPVLWWPTEAIRTDGLRWFPGAAHFYRKQPGTVAGMMLSLGVCRCKSIKFQFSADVFKAEF